MKRLIIILSVLAIAHTCNHAWGDEWDFDCKGDVLMCRELALEYMKRKAPDPPTQKWKYYTVGVEIFVSYLSNEELSRMGDLGWELIGVIPSVSGSTIYHFKRPKQEP